MYLVRDVFKAKPGKAGALAGKFKKALPYLSKDERVKSYRVMTDIVSSYWTVVIEFEISDIGAFVSNLRSATASPEVVSIMEGYMDLVEGGHREVFLIE